MGRKRVRDLRAMIEGPMNGNSGAGDCRMAKKSLSPTKKHGESVLDRIRAKEKLGIHVTKQEEARKKKEDLDRKQIVEVENRVREILREKRAGGEVLSRRKLCLLVEDSFLGYMESKAVESSVEKVLGEKKGVLASTNKEVT